MRKNVWLWSLIGLMTCFGGCQDNFTRFDGQSQNDVSVTLGKDAKDARPDLTKILASTDAANFERDSACQEALNKEIESANWLEVVEVARQCNLLGVDFHEVVRKKMIEFQGKNEMNRALVAGEAFGLKMPDDLPNKAYDEMITCGNGSRAWEISERYRSQNLFQSWHVEKALTFAAVNWARDWCFYSGKVSVDGKLASTKDHQACSDEQKREGFRNLMSIQSRKMVDMNVVQSMLTWTNAGLDINDAWEIVKRMNDESLDKDKG